MDIQVLDSIAATGVDNGLVLHVRDGEVVDGVVQGGWDRVLWQPGCRADRDWGGGARGGRDLRLVVGASGGGAKGGGHW